MSRVTITQELVSEWANEDDEPISLIGPGGYVLQRNALARRVLELETLARDMAKEFDSFCYFADCPNRDCGGCVSIRTRLAAIGVTWENT